MIRILVLAGGSSEERAVSLRSGQAVAAALKAAGYEVTVQDPQHSSNFGQPDLVFSVLHGKGGEDGRIQRLLEQQHLPYVGSGVDASVLCFDKWTYKRLLMQHGIPTAPATKVTAADIWDSPLIKKPFVLKPNDGGSSIDTHVVRNVSQMNKTAIMDTLAQRGTMLLETLAEGMELTVGVLGTAALPVIEIVPPNQGEFDYENKYNGNTLELCPPVHISLEVQEKAQELALRIHQLTGCRDLSRTDMIVSPDGLLTVLETNTMPGMTDASLFPKAAQAYGLSMQQLVTQLVEMAELRHGKINRC